MQDSEQRFKTVSRHEFKWRDSETEGKVGYCVVSRGTWAKQANLDGTTLN